MTIDLLGLAWGQMRANLRRCLLALIGVAIGVSVLAALSDLGRLTQVKTTESLAKLGLADIISVQMGQADQRWIDPRTSDRLEASLPFVKAVSAQAVLSSATIHWDKYVLERKEAAVWGVEPDFGEMMNLKTSEGRFLGQADAGEKVCVVGWAVASLLGDRERLRVGNQVFHVVGRLAKNPWPASEWVVFVSFETAARRLGLAGASRELRIKVDDIGRLEEYQARLRDWFEASGVDERALFVRYNLKAVEHVLRTVRLFNGFLIVLGLTTLFLGGLGISNTLLASAAERTREIGIRKAVGARAADIFGQFLLEAVLLCLVGAAAGVGLAWGLVATAMRLMPGSPPAHIEAGTAALAVGAALLFGVGFSLWPVGKASRLDVVQALRSF